MKFIRSKTCKILLCIVLLIAVIGGYSHFMSRHPAHLQISQPVLSIVIHRSGDYDPITITDQDEIEALVSQINAWELCRAEKLDAYTGWEIFLDVYLQNRESPLQLTFHGGGIDYNNYLYGPEDETVEFMSSLQTRFA
ncbi:MAG: hypothetical protein LUG58_02630 [Clostridiales bacterium]|nr:hypothetical protein [Clostridiales bacterium]